MHGLTDEEKSCSPETIFSHVGVTYDFMKKKVLNEFAAFGKMPSDSEYFSNKSRSGRTTPCQFSNAQNIFTIFYSVSFHLTLAIGTLPLFDGNHFSYLRPFLICDFSSRKCNKGKYAFDIVITENG